MTAPAHTAMTADVVRGDFGLQSDRLKWIPVTDDLLRHEVQGSLSAGLGLKVPSSWPPETVPPPPGTSRPGWTFFYLATVGDQGQRMLAGVIGVNVWPEKTTVQVGVRIVPECRDQGFAKETIGAVGAWGLAQPGVDVVISDVFADNTAGIAVLERLGFVPRPELPAPGLVRYELQR